jgi:hypothetical protein
VTSTFGQVVLGNQFGTLSQVIFGPDPSGGAAFSSAAQYETDLVARPALSIPAGKTTYIVAENGAGTPFVKGIAVQTLGETVGGRILGRALGALNAAQLVYDAGVYVGALAVCAGVGD